MFKDQLILELNPGFTANGDIQHHDLSPTSEELKHCEKLVIKLLPVTITVSTPWKHTILIKPVSVYVRNDGIIHDMDLHGSGSIDP